MNVKYMCVRERENICLYMEPLASGFYRGLVGRQMLNGLHKSSEKSRGFYY